jgi:septation ring formation regulator EzrA
VSRVENKKVDLRKRENEQLTAIGDERIKAVDTLNELRLRISKLTRYMDTAPIGSAEKRQAGTNLANAKEELARREKNLQLSESLSSANVTADGISKCSRGSGICGRS